MNTKIELKTSTGKVTASAFHLGNAQGIQLFVNDVNVCTLIVDESNSDDLVDTSIIGETRLIVSNKKGDICFSINQEGVDI